MACLSSIVGLFSLVNQNNQRGHDRYCAAKQTMIDWNQNIAAVSQRLTLRGSLQGRPVQRLALFRKGLRGGGNDESSGCSCLEPIAGVLRAYRWPTPYAYSR